MSGGGQGFPALPRRGLGVGLDVRWGDRAGFDVDGEGRDRVAPALRAFVDSFGSAQAPRLAHAFFSWQPRDRARLRLDDYAPAWDDLVGALPRGLPLGLHHTALDLAALEAVPRGALLDFTNALCARYGFAWINEDVGFWSVAGRPVPYPLPPVLDPAGLRACVRNVRECQRGLDVPLVLEFPGFSAEVGGALGAMDAYDFFRALAEETGAPVTLDVGHLLSWRWWRGARGEALYDGLERLPLAHAFELHLSGCEVRGERFVDAHHGQLLDEQLVLTERLLEVCPHLRAVTFEDPRIEDGGGMEAASARSFERLRRVTAAWAESGAPHPAPSGPTSPPATPADFVGALAAARGEGELFEEAATSEAALAARLMDVAAPSMVELLRTRAQRGTGRVEDAFPRCVAGWRAMHPEDATLDGLYARFLASPAIGAWREQPGVVGGACLEECFAAFARDERLAAPSICEEELLSAVLRALTVAPRPAFDPPPGVRRAPGGWFALSSADPPVLHAATGGRYLRGPVTPAITAILLGAPATQPALAPVRARLVELGLVAA